MRRIHPKRNQPTRTEQALDALVCAQAEASNHGSSPIIEMYEREHNALLVPVEGSSDVVMGEVVPLDYKYKSEDDYVVSDAIATDVIRDTLLQPNIDAVSIDASMCRTRLLHNAGALELGLDLSKTIGSKNSMEKMFAHQMAALHAKSMECMTKAADFPRGREDLEIKMLNVACRMMTVYQQGMEALSKTRNGGKQTIVVKQIKVEGGQNVIADNVTTRGGGSNGGD